MHSDQLVPYPTDLPEEHDLWGDDVTEDQRVRYHQWVLANSQRRQAAAAENLAREKARGTQVMEAAGFVFVVLFVYLFVDFDFSLNL